MADEALPESMIPGCFCDTNFPLNITICYEFSRTVCNKRISIIKSTTWGQPLLEINHLKLWINVCADASGTKLNTASGCSTFICNNKALKNLPEKFTRHCHK